MVDSDRVDLRLGRVRALEQEQVPVNGPGNGQLVYTFSVLPLGGRRGQDLFFGGVRITAFNKGQRSRIADPAVNTEWSVEGHRNPVQRLHPGDLAELEVLIGHSRISVVDERVEATVLVEVHGGHRRVRLPFVGPVSDLFGVGECVFFEHLVPEALAGFLPAFEGLESMKWLKW